MSVLALALGGLSLASLLGLGGLSAGEEHERVRHETSLTVPSEHQVT